MGKDENLLKFNIFDLIIYNGIVGWICKIEANFIYVEFISEKEERRILFKSSTRAVVRAYTDEKRLVFYNKYLIEDIKENRCIHLKSMKNEI